MTGAEIAAAPAGLGPAEIWATIIGLFLASYAIRFSFFGLLGGRTLPPGLVRALGFVPVTVLPALIAPMVFIGEGGGLAVEPAVLGAAAASLAAGVLVRNMLAGVIGGVAGYVVMRGLGF